MKKRNLFFLVVFSLFCLVGITSCKECSTCVAKDKATAVEVTKSDFCGTSTEVKNNEDAFKNQYGTNNDVVCTKTD